jgi:hypothetical protein
MRISKLMGAVGALLFLNLSLVTSTSFAGTLVDDPDWKEVEVPAPPSFNKDKLIRIEMPAYVSLRFGVDPATLSVTADGIVRYVMVATSASGSATAMYEGIRCAAGEFKTYARYSSSGQWAPVADPQWRPLNDNNTSRHALAFARQGACDGRSAAASSVQAIVSALKTPVRDPR